MAHKKRKQPGMLEQLKDGIPNPRVQRVCVIGAGSSGLVTIKELKDESHEVVCYEKSDREGGVFSTGNRNENDTTATAYEGLSLNVSNYFMAFSSLPPEDEKKRYWTHKEYSRYLGRFAEQYDLIDHIVFNSEVRDVRRLRNGKWEVEVSVAGKVRTSVFDSVVVGTGRYHEANMPEVEGLKKFGGEVSHSSTYRNPSAYKGKKVVVVGLGESGADICKQISYVAESTTVVVRRPPHITHKNLLPHTGKDDTHDAMFSPFIFALEDYKYDQKYVQMLLRNQAHSFLENMIPNIKDPEARLVREWENMGGGFPGGPLVNSDGFLRNVVSGDIDVNFFGIKKVEKKHVTFGDGTRVEADVILFCTGYTDSFDFFKENAHIREVEENPRRLFKHMFHPAMGENLAFIGFARPIAGGIPMISELQARYFAKVCSGKIQLPREDMAEIVREDERKEDTYFYVAPENKSLVVLHEYTSWFAEEIGCMPGRGFWWRNPGLWKKYFFTSTSSYFFRLMGPGNMRKKAEILVRKQENCMNGFGVTIFFILIAKTRIESFLDRTFFHFMTRKIALKQKEQQDVTTFLKRIFREQKIEPDFNIKLCCADKLQWSNLKYKLQQHYGMDPANLTDAMTLRDLEKLVAS